MLKLEDAQAEILAKVQPLAIETVPLSAGLGRFAADRVVSTIDLPPFDNSAMDGYAVRAEDISRVTPENPVALELVGQAAAGEVFDGEMSVGQCVRVFTGSPLPTGANAVIMQEETKVDPAQPRLPWMCGSVKPWENIRLRGEDIKREDAIITPGERLTSGRIGLLGATGCSQIQVGQQPVIGLIATGSELVEPGQPLAPGQIYESNRICLAALSERAGAHTRIYPIVKDNLVATKTALTTAFAECHAVVTSGGVSVGEMDLVKAAFESLGGELAFWRVAIKPGKPFVLGQWKERLLFGLPGNPVSAFVTFLLLVRPALLRFQGAQDIHLPSVPGVLAEPIRNPGDRRHLVRVVIDGAGQVRSAGAQASHLLRSLAGANGLIDVPPESNLPAGAAVRVLRWE